MTNKIFIKIPANAIAGGVESLYQLSDAINNLGGNSIVVWDNKNNNSIPVVYSNYNIKYVDSVEDSEDNMIIYPEIWTEQIFNYKNIKKCIWWLSVDNNHNKFQNFNNDNVLHLYQSFYALNFLIKNNTYTYLPMFDYISDDFLCETFDTKNKENIITYNPVKGFDITNKIISDNKHLNFVPITGMDRKQIIDLLKISKVYIDFGHHPGRDRIPREAAYLGNIVITNNRGSAGFYNDIPIPSKFKINDLTELKNLFNLSFYDYEKEILNFDLYRSIIKNQKEQLYNLCRQTFKL